MAWLSALPHHSLFTLPPPSDFLTPSSHPTKLLLPASPGALPALSSTRREALSQSASSRSLFRLSSPSPSSPSSNQTPKRTTRQNGPDGRTPAKQNGAKREEGLVKGGRQSRMVIVRGSEVVVAVGKELRMASLADVKARCRTEEDALDEDLELGEYKTLDTPAITFDIQQLVLNSTSKLLAVVGAHSVVVVVLPRKGWANSLGKALECRSLPVGTFYHSLPGSPLVAQALWHPWGVDASSLLVLTADSTLREYTISEDVEEPSQVVSFAKKKTSAAGGGGFSAEDRDASRAVGMCIGEGKGDWGPLTVYGLMRNGDVLSLCPFLPKKALIPPSYIHSLSAFVSAEVDFLASSEAAAGALTRFDPYASVTSTSTPFGTPSKALSTSRATPSTPSSASHLRTPTTFSKRYNLQLQYVNSLARQVSTSSAKTPSSPAHDDEEEVDSDEPVRIVVPSRSDFTPALQGPFLLQPAPAELDNGAPSSACDIAYVSYSSASPAAAAAEESAGSASIGLIALSYADGKVDLCVEVEKVEARWEAEKEAKRVGSLALSRPVGRRTGYGFAPDADSDSEEDEGGAEEDELEGLPTLAMYETIDLGLADEINPSRAEKGEKAVATALKDNYPVLTRDPLYADTLYIYHALGAHCLLLAPWLEELLETVQEGDDAEEGNEEKLQKQAEKTLKKQQRTEVLWVLKTRSTSPTNEEPTPPVVALQVVNDVYLGYSLLSLTSSLQAVGIELSLRIDSSAVDPSTSTSSAAPSSSKSAYVSLLDTPFTIPALLTPGKPLPRLPTPFPASSFKELSITPSTLRDLGKTVTSVQTSVRELASAADTVSHRLELQMKELSRQLGKLAELKQLRNDLGKSVSATGGGADGSTEARLQRVEATQRQLIERTDRVLQRLMEHHQPEISTYERKWFDELGRLEGQVYGEEDGEGGEGVGQMSLETRARRVEAQWEALKPAVEEMKNREGRDVGTPVRGGLGQGQVKALEGKLADEAKLIAEARRKVERLTSTLAATSLA